MTRNNFSALIATRCTIGRLGLVAERGPAGVFANVRHVVCHSPSGMDYGHAGPGSADLALSSLCAIIAPPDPAAERSLHSLSPPGYDEADADDRLWSVVTPRGERISRLAWRLHQPFKRTFVMAMKDDGPYVPLDIILSWIDVQSQALIERDSLM